MNNAALQIPLIHWPRACNFVFAQANNFSVFSLLIMTKNGEHTYVLNFQDCKVGIMSETGKTKQLYLKKGIWKIKISGN